MLLENSLSYMRDHIRDSKTHKVSAIIDPEDFYALGFDSIEDMLPLIDKITQLPVSNQTLDVIDFDDTLYSRTPQLQESRFQENRGEKGNQMIQETWGGYDGFVDRYYKTKTLVSQLVNVLLSDQSIILTAGRNELQNSKLKRTRLDAAGIVKNIVSSSEKKPRQLLEFIVNELGYIPGKIIIYDDKVRYFKKAGPVLTKLLGGIEIVIDKVTLKDPDIGNIRRIDQTIYSVH